LFWVHLYAVILTSLSLFADKHPLSRDAIVPPVYTTVFVAVANGTAPPWLWLNQAVP